MLVVATRVNKLLVIPGLGDRRPAYGLLLTVFRLLGMQPELYIFGWNDTPADDFATRLAALLAYIDAQPSPVSIIGISAGGMAALHAFIDRPAQVKRVVTISSPVSGHESSPIAVVYAAYQQLLAKTPRLTVAQKSCLLTMCGLRDKVVNTTASRLPGVRHITVCMVGHVASIGMACLLYAGRIRSFLS